MEELNPIRMINSIIKYWWIPAVAIILGGVIGFIFSTFHKPVYEATAQFYVTLDLNKFGDRVITDYEEDMALSGTIAILTSDQVTQEIDKASQAQNLKVNMATLFSKDYTLERDHAFWYLRYRNTDPHTAQKFVNLWAQTGYQAMLDWQSKNMIVDYVKFSAPKLARLPIAPLEYSRKMFILAGALIGLVTGVILSNLLAARVSR